MELGGVELFIPLMQRKNEGARILSLKIIVSLLSLLPKKSIYLLYLVVSTIITNDFCIKIFHSLGEIISFDEYECLMLLCYGISNDTILNNHAV